MQKKILCIAFILGLAGNIQVNAQYSKTDSSYHKWFIGTSLFVLIGNFDTKNPPNFVQLDNYFRAFVFHFLLVAFAVRFLNY